MLTPLTSAIGPRATTRIEIETSRRFLRSTRGLDWWLISGFAPYLDRRGELHAGFCSVVTAVRRRHPKGRGIRGQVKPPTLIALQALVAAWPVVEMVVAGIRALLQ
jgi:hypothetical protein